MCPPGTSNAGINNFGCSSCPIGSVVVTMLPLNCTTCSAGKFVNSSTAHLDSTLKCKNCPVGRYLEDDGNDHTQHAMLSSCKQCKKGHQYTSATTPCIVCLAGKYQDSDISDDVNCKLCPLGQFNLDRGELVGKHDSVNDCGKDSVIFYLVNVSRKY